MVIFVKSQLLMFAMKWTKTKVELNESGNHLWMIFAIKHLIAGVAMKQQEE